MRVEMTREVREEFVTPDVMIELGLADPEVTEVGYAFDLDAGAAEELASLLLDRAATRAGMVGRRSKVYRVCVEAIRLSDAITARI